MALPSKTGSFTKFPLLVISLLLAILTLTVLLFPVNFGSPQFPVFATTSTKIEKEIGKKKEKEDSIKKQLSDLESRIKELQGNIARFENQLSVTEQELAVTSAEVTKLENKIASLEEQISALEKDREAKETLRNKLVRRLYKEQRLPFWEVLLEGRTSARLSKAVVYQSRTISELKNRIAKVNQDIASAKEDRERLTASKNNLAAEVRRLAALKTSLAQKKVQAEQSARAAAQKKNALSSELQKITSEIRELVRAKLAETSEGSTVGDTAPLRTDVPDPPFSPAYAAYSRGYPHRVGLNQYGAKGRAEEGQSYKEIIKAYYKDVNLDSDYDCPDEITVTGSFGSLSLDFEDEYLKGIAEMPADWPMEALKAQAIAARSYALAYTRDGASSICTTQSCQVWRRSKMESSSAERWHEAVEDTEGVVVTHDGDAIRAWYASTFGGASRLPTDFDVGWNTSPAYVERIVDNSEGELSNWSNSYDKDSPWFYKAWYDNDYDKYPWLTEEEMQDLFNAALLLDNDSSLEKNLFQEEPIAFQDREPGWSKEKVREELGKREIDSIGNIKEINCGDSSEGYTYIVNVISENYSEGKDIPGEVFHKIFNIRSPGYLALWSSLFDIERKTD
ncbi:MAG: SpoIID/LytB domain-containing protein [Patescibacteria group bacterium]